MRNSFAVLSVVLAVTSLNACDGSTPARPGGSGGRPAGSGGKAGNGGAISSGGWAGNGGAVGSGGWAGSGGRAGGGASGTSSQAGVCPYNVVVFSCDAACKKLHTFSTRCQDDPTVPAEVKATLGLYGQVEVICTSTCAVVSPSTQAQWGCFQGIPDDAPCSAIAGCNATNCP